MDDPVQAKSAIEIQYDRLLSDETAFPVHSAGFAFVSQGQVNGISVPREVADAAKPYMHTIRQVTWRQLFTEAGLLPDPRRPGHEPTRGA